MVNVAIIGATGFSGAELCNILKKHPKASIKYSTGRNWETVGSDIDLVFLALPHGVSSTVAVHFLSKGIHVIDLANDFRNIASSYSKIIAPKIADFHLENMAYSIPELHRNKLNYSKIKLLANPGCYPTSALIALAPLFIKKDHGGLSDLFNLSDKKIPVIIDSKSGYSGAGKKFVNSKAFDNLKDNLWAYKIAGEHNHAAEIKNQLNNNAISFSPHILPLERGILSTIYVDFTIIEENLKDKINTTQFGNSILDYYRQYYKKEPFIKITEDLPTIKDVQKTNNCHLGLRYDTANQKLVIVSVIDNLVKGAAGQAIQNMNLMLGIDETTGLL